MSNELGNKSIKKGIYWNDVLKVPVIVGESSSCGTANMSYMTTDLRPVFPEERLLLALIQNQDPGYYQDKNVWFGNGMYFVDGQKEKLNLAELSSISLEQAKNIKDNFDLNRNSISYSSFDSQIDKFTGINGNHFNSIVDEAMTYIQGFSEHTAIEDMMVSFSGGKDSTVTSSLVCRALGTTKILHLFGDTTLEFPYTYEYKKRFLSNEESKGIRVLTAKNREKKFFDLCEVVGPPSRVMRWCCTVFKTGAIQKTIASAFKDKKNVITYYGIRRSESASRSKYERETDSPKIAKQTVVSPIIDWMDIDIWLYILTTKIDFNEAYRLGYSRVGCWCCPNNSRWSEFLTKIFLNEESEKWREQLIKFSNKIGKPDSEDYVDGGFWKARQGGNGLDEANKSIIKFEPCATQENTFNYTLQKPISNQLYELFKPFGDLNYSMGNPRFGEVYIINPSGKPVLLLRGRPGTYDLRVTIYDNRIAGANSLSGAEKKVQCQLTKFQMCLSCKACEGVCKFDAISVRETSPGDVVYLIDSNKCVHCTECVNHFDAGCYMRKVLGIKRG